MGQKEQERFMKRASELAFKAVREGAGGPFGAVVVKEGKIVGEGYNCVTSHNDPSAHAEIMAIRDACKTLNSFQLTGCDIYSSCEPCPMCLGAIYWARPERLFYSASRYDAAKAGFDDEFIYKELTLPEQTRRIPVIRVSDRESVEVFTYWKNRENKTAY